MRKFATGKTEAADAADYSASKKTSGNWLKEHKCAVALVVIMILALVIRVIFSWSISSQTHFALSGGTDASSHLRVIMEILAGTYDPASQSQLNFPYGTVSVSGPVYDYLMAIPAYLVTLVGVNNSAAASGAMAFSAPIFAVLTAIPIFKTVKKLTDDNTISLFAVLLFEFCPLVISVTPFSYGAEYALLGFLAAMMVYFLVCAIMAADENNASGLAAVKEKNVLVPAVLAGVFYGLVALTWTGFRVIVIVAAAILFVHLIVRRVGGKDMGASVGISTVVLGLGTVIAAVYYIPFGLWDAVFSGACVLAIMTIVYSVAFVALEKKPWVITIPVFAVVIVGVAAVIYFVAPGLSHDILSGNNVYEPGLVTELAETFSRSSISAMATWFGWLAVWCPMFMGAYMLYRYRRDGGKRIYDFTALWLLAMFFISWFDSQYAILAAAAMSIGSAMVIVKVFRAVDLVGYFRSYKTLRGSGFKGAAKKVFNFFPFVTVVVAVALIAAPGAMYAVDAATPTNDEKSDYFGGMGYTISTYDSNLVNRTWSHYSYQEKEGALLSWYGYSDNAAAFGKFTSVTSSYGDGSAAMSMALLQNGSAGALVSMSVRLLGTDYEKISAACSAATTHVTINADNLYKILSDDSVATLTIAGTDFEKLGTQSNIRAYYAAYEYLVNDLGLNLNDLAALYESVRTATGESISYIEVDSSMLPTYYRDSSIFSTVAYLGGYEVDDYGAVEDFYSINTYSGYAYYTDLMYETLAYKALIGILPSDAGETYSISLLSDLSLSDGTVKAVPGLGLPGFEVDYWLVMYNPDSDATGSSDGWVRMKGYEAIALQEEQGGLINYLASAVTLKYVGIGDTVSGNVTDGTDGISGVTVNVYAENTADAKANMEYVLYSSCVTDTNGYYSVALPDDAKARVVYSTSASGRADGNVVQTDTYEAGAISASVDVTISPTPVSGYLVDSNGNNIDFTGNMTFTLSGADEPAATVTVTNGSFDAGNLVPGTYAVAIYDKTADKGASVSTATLTVISGAASNVALKATTYAVTVTVTDYYTALATEGVDVTLRNTSTGAEYTGTSNSDGKAVIYVFNGTYAYYASDSDYVSMATSTTTVSSSAKSVSLSVYPAREITVTVGGASGSDYSVTVYNQNYSTVTTDGTAKVPCTMGYSANYFALAKVGSTYYYGSGNGATIDLTETAVRTVSGVVVYNGTAVSGATVAVDGESVFVTATTDSDGKYSMTVPSTAELALYAYDSDNHAYIQTLAAGTDAATVDVNLIDGKKDYVYMYYQTGRSSGSTKYLIGMDNFTATVTYNEVTYTLNNLLTNSSGKSYIYIPSDATLSINVEAIETDYLVIGKLNSDTGDYEDYTYKISGTSMSLVVYGVEPSSSSSASGNSHIKTVVPATLDPSEFGTGTINGTMTAVTFTQTGSSEKVTYTVTDNVINAGDAVVPGQYTFEPSGFDTSGASGMYYGGDIFVYPNNVLAVRLGSDPFEATYLEFTVSSGDTVTVTAEDDGQYEEKDLDEDTKVGYYFEMGSNFVVNAVDSDGKTAEASVSNAGTPSATDLTSKKTFVTVAGNLDAPNAAGTFDVSYVLDAVTTTVSVTVADGAYEVSVPAGAVVTFEMDGTEGVEYEENGVLHTYQCTSVEFTVPADQTEAMTCNLGCYSLETDVDGDYADIVTAVMGTDGSVSLSISLDYSGDSATLDSMTFVITGNGGVTLDKTYTATVAKGGSTTVSSISGWYNPVTLGAGSSNASVLIKTVDGTTLQTLQIPASAFASSTGGKVTLTTTSNAEEVYDGVNGYSYRYAFSFKNENTYAVNVFPTGTFTGEGFTAYMADSDGNYVKELTGTTGSSVTINGLATSTVYLVLVSQSKLDASSVPGLAYSFTAATVDSGSAVTIEGDSSGTVSKQAVSVSETGSSVSGEGSDNNAKGISNLFYALVILVVLMAIVFIWAASKRGVFSRN